jgi:ribosomal protein S18 acetylase RimI-like enzyme
VVIREATRRDARRLAAGLASAFDEDPLYRWMFGGRMEWRRHSREFFRVFLRVHLRDGRVLTTDQRAGAALWVVPDLPFGGRMTQLVLPFRMRRLFGRRAELIRREMARLNAGRPLEPHWYLPVLGVAPQYQRMGIGSALLGPVLDECDFAGHPAYLETSVEDNVSFYRRLGFEVADALEVEGGPHVWGMVRVPRSETGARSE